MKFCSNCGAQCEDNVVFCPSCGNSFDPAKASAASADPFDHTAEFDPKDISDNKVIAMLCYLLGSIGVIIALLAANKSDYAAFHVRQALKFTVVNVLLGIVAIVLAITIVVPIAAAICMGIVSVLRIIAFFQICCGKAKEPAIILNLKFLR